MESLSFLKESLRTLTSRILLVLANIPISILIARCLGPDGQSIYSSATTYATNVAVIGLLGVDAAHTYYLASGRYRSAQILGNSMLLLGGLSLLLVPLFPLIIKLATGSADNMLGSYLSIAALMIPIISVRYLLLSIFMARRRIEAFNLIYLTGNLLLAALLALGFGFYTPSASWGLWAFIISQLVMVIIAIGWVWRHETNLANLASISFKPVFSLSLLRDSFHYGLRGFLGTILTTFIYRFDTILVLRWLGNTAQGHYFIAVFLAEKLTHITASVQAVLFPTISKASREEADALTPRVCRQTLFWVSLAAGALYLLATPFILLFYSDRFSASIVPMQILLPGIAALTISKLLSADLSGRDKRFMPTLIMTITLGANLWLNYLWTRPHGISGAAWASTVAYCAQALLMLLYFWRVTGIAPGQILLPDRSDALIYRRMFDKLKERRRASREGDGNEQ